VTPRATCLVLTVMRKAALLALRILGTASCDSWLSPGEEWVEWPALILVSDDPPTIDAPETALRATSFDVRFSTILSHGCMEHAQNRLVVDGLNVHIHSTQRERQNADDCTQAIRITDHVVPVTVSVAGTATIHLHGRSSGGGESVFTRAVTITP
jgi:hypothetical protein